MQLCRGGEKEIRSPVSREGRGSSVVIYNTLAAVGSGTIPKYWGEDVGGEQREKKKGGRSPSFLSGKRFTRILLGRKEGERKELSGAF